MATWANALNKVHLDISQGGPKTVWEIKDHAIGSGEEVVVDGNIDLRSKPQNPNGVWTLYWGFNVTAGTGTPTVVIQWLNGNDEVLSEEVLSVSEFGLHAQKARVLVRETGTNTATYSGIISLR